MEMAESKIVIITCAKSGFGRATAHLFAKEKYTIIVACRNLKKSKYAQQDRALRATLSTIDGLIIDI